MYFDAALHRALRIKAAETDRSSLVTKPTVWPTDSPSRSAMRRAAARLGQTLELGTILRAQLGQQLVYFVTTLLSMQIEQVRNRHGWFRIPIGRRFRFGILFFFQLLQLLRQVLLARTPTIGVVYRLPAGISPTSALR